MSAGFYAIGCKTEQSSTRTGNNEKRTVTERPFAVQPSQTAGSYVLALGDPVEVRLEQKTDTVSFNAIYFYSGNTFVDSATTLLEKYTVTPLAERVGQQQLRTVVRYNDTLTDMHFVPFIYHSDKEPRELSYNIIRKIPHDNKAYVQGLVFYNGFLYEGTGHKGASSVRKINPQTGEVLKLVDLEHKYFGEGIAAHKGKIYQITWQSQTGFVYDADDLALLRTIHYDFREGWGLASDGERLIMSDGSAKIYFIEPDMLTELGRTEVYDHEGMVPRINELEYVEGVLFANVYGKKYIIAIDPLSGKVTGRLDLSMLFPDGLPDDMDHVLNGIAYNPETGYFYATGKYWPVMYEIRISGWK